MKKLFLTLPLALGASLAFHCGDDGPSGPDDIDYNTVIDISFTQHVQKILTEYETILQANGVFPEGLQMDSWQNLIKGWERGEVIIPFDAENSLLIELTEKLDNPNELREDKLRLLKRWITDGAKNDNDEVPYANSRKLLYVCDQDAARISVIDTDAKLVIRTVDLLKLNRGFSLGSKPHHLAVEPDGSFWYVSLTGAGKVLKFDRNNEFVAEATISIPALLAAHPNNGLLYVSRFPLAPGGDEPLIGVIRRSDMEVLDDIAVQPTPHAMAADHSGKFVYTCSLSGNQIIAIDAATNQADETFVDLGPSKGPIQLTISADDNTLYVSALISNEVYVVDVSDPTERKVINTIAVNATPWHPVLTPDGSRLYVGNQGAHTISAIDVASGAVTVIGAGTGVDGIAQPHGIAVTNDGKFVFVSNRNVLGLYKPRFDFGEANANIGTVAVVNTATNTLEKIIEIEQFGSGMASSPE
ncbi:MAG: beta-propeller fold lactonase family protein [bacterium]